MLRNNVHVTKLNYNFNPLRLSGKRAPLTRDVHPVSKSFRDSVDIGTPVPDFT